MEGYSIVSPAMAGKLLAEVGAGGRHRRTEVPAGPILSERELEIVRLMAMGLRNREIARKLYLSENTVKTHVANVLGKLHLRSRTEAAMYATRARLV